jgi:hypothetical protein
MHALALAGADDTQVAALPVGTLPASGMQRHVATAAVAQQAATVKHMHMYSLVPCPAA